jgi:hypothetical protein
MMDKLTTKVFINMSFAGILLLATIVVSNVAIANEPTSASFGGLSKNLTTENRIDIARENKIASIDEQDINKSTNKTRAEILNSKTNNVSKVTPLARSYSYSYDADFTIYGATSLLHEDYDGDGFHQTFSVIFDADLYSYTSGQLGEVFALLYISKNGGPWTHYYTTDNFLIEGDSDLDEYEVVTTFLSGYSTDHYDILIDLYQVGYSDTVATYSSDDSNALFALSLESADYDEPYYDEPYFEVIEISHGGSFSIIIILLLLLTFVIRTNRQSH